MTREEAIKVLTSVAVCSRPILDCEDCPARADGGGDCKIPSDRMIEQAIVTLQRKVTTDDDLNSCPFCGGDVHFDRSYSYFRDVVIYCDECDTIFALDDCTAVDSDLARAWNRRADNG